MYKMFAALVFLKLLTNKFSIGLSKLIFFGLLLLNLFCYLTILLNDWPSLSMYIKDQKYGKWSHCFSLNDLKVFQW